MISVRIHFRELPELIRTKSRTSVLINTWNAGGLLGWSSLASCGQSMPTCHRDNAYKCKVWYAYISTDKGWLNSFEMPTAILSVGECVDEIILLTIVHCAWISVMQNSDPKSEVLSGLFTKKKDQAKAWFTIPDKQTSQTTWWINHWQTNLVWSTSGKNHALLYLKLLVLIESQK